MRGEAHGQAAAALNAFRDSVIQEIDDIYKAGSVVGRSGTVHRLHSGHRPGKGRLSVQHHSG
jgi:hypothetical protein